MDPNTLPNMALAGYAQGLSKPSAAILEQMVVYHADRLRTFERDREARRQLKERGGKAPRLDLWRMISQLRQAEPVDGEDLEILQEYWRSMNIPGDSRRPVVPYDVFFKRDLTAGAAGAGGYLVSTQVGEAATSMQLRGIVSAFGATILPDLAGNVTIPVTTTGPGVTWLSTEGSTITEQTPSLGQIALSPKTVGTSIDLSRQLSKQSNAGDVVVQELGTAIGSAIDSVAISGSAASGQPVGLLNTANVNAVTGTGLPWDKVLDFIVNAGTANLDVTGFAMPVAIYKLLANRVRLTGGSIPIVHDGLIDGRPARHTAAVPAATLVGGPWPDMVIGLWGGVELLVDPSTQFKQSIISVRAMLTLDVGIRHPAAFSKSTSIT